MGPIRDFKTAMAAKWVANGFTDTPLLYGFREVIRTKSIEAVALGNGRIVWHAGSFAGAGSNAGELTHEHVHPTTTGRSVANSWNVFTVHCHGLDPAYPDATAEDAELAHDDAAWRLREMFFGALPDVASANKWLLQYGSQTWVRDPEQRRIGELLVCEFSIRFAIRSLPVYPKTPFTQKPTGVVVTPNETAVTIVGGP